MIRHWGYNWEFARAIIDIIDAHAVIYIYMYTSIFCFLESVRKMMCHWVYYWEDARAIIGIIGAHAVI